MAYQEPTVYTLPNVYAKAGGGFTPEFGGVDTNLIIATETKGNYLNGVICGDKYYYVNINGATQKWSLTKKTPVDITSFNSLIWKFGFNLNYAYGGSAFNNLFGCNRNNAFIDSQLTSAYNLTVRILKNGGSVISSFAVGSLSVGDDHILEFNLDKVNSKIIIQIDGVTKVNTSLDFTQIDTTSFLPAYGCNYASSSCWLHDGVKIMREMSLLVDGVEKFDTL